MASKTHVVLPGSNRPRDPDAEKVGKPDPKQKIDVTLDLAGPDLPAADQFVGQTLTPEELAEKYGTKKADANKVAKVLRRFGLKIEDVSLATRSMRVSGTIAAMEAAFKPQLMLMRSARQGDYRGRQGTLQIPAELRGLVKSVLGLDQRRMARRKASSRAAASGSLAALGPADLEKRYNFPSGDCAGQKIAVAEFGGGYFASDVTAYCTKFQRQIPQIQPVSVDAPAYTLQQILALPKQQRMEELDNSIEVMMDVEIVAGLCAGADISVYFSTFDQQGWVDLLDKVITDKPVVASVSWGLAEDDPSWSSSARTAIDNRLNSARLLGITVCISSGDDGSGDQIDDGRGHVDFPSCSPNTLSIGGTMLKKSGSAVKEVTWWDSPGRRTNNGGGATGGGVSIFFNRPAWQNVKVKSINPKSIDGRVMPDVAALAGEPMYDLIIVNHPQVNGGTSASTPLWAALIARINAQLPVAKKQRFITPLLYQNGLNGQPIGKGASQDITTGNNTSNPKPGKGYKAGKGFDAVTGWGVPDGVKLLAALAAI
jgi:kumamolisin